MYRNFILDNFRYASYTTQTKRLRVGRSLMKKSTYIKQENTKMSINYNKGII